MTDELLILDRPSFAGAGKKKKDKLPPEYKPAPDTLFSEDSMEVMLALGEGPMWGPEEGGKSFRLDGVPLKNQNGEENYKYQHYRFYDGTPGQGPITSILGGHARSNSVNVSLEPGLPVVRQTQTGGLDYIEIRLVNSSLYHIEKPGLTNLTCTVQVEFKPVTHSAWWVRQHTWTGKTTSNPYVKELRIPIPRTTEPWDIRVTLVDGKDPYVVRTVNWESFQEVDTSPRSYDNTAVAHFVARFTDQLNKIPEIDSICRGLYVRVPSNYDPVWRTYTGAWNGTFKMAWTDNPALCLYDLVMNDRYGLRSIDPSVTLNKWDVYEAAQWCDGVVGTKDGTTYTFDAYSAVPIGGTKVKLGDANGQALEFYGATKTIGYLLTVPATGTYTIYMAADDLVDVTIDQTYINSAGSDGKTVNWDLTAGTHVVRCAVHNIDIPGNNVPGTNPHTLDLVIRAANGSMILASSDTSKVIRGSYTTAALPEPRYTFNAVLADPRQGIEQLRYMAGAFNAALWDDFNGEIRLKVDKPEDPAALFTQENVNGGTFTYSFSDLSTRYNDITVSFVNPDLDWNEDRRRVFNQDHINKYGRIPLNFVAVGCIYEAEAIRRATYKMETSIGEVMSVSFKLNRRGMFLRPFDVILVADPDMLYSLTGRMVSISADRKTVYLRDQIYLEPGIAYDFTTDTPTGPWLSKLKAGQPTGYRSSIEIADPLPANLPEYAVFSLGSVGQSYGAPKPFRVMSIIEVEGNPDEFEVVAIETSRSKWPAADAKPTLPEKVPGPTAPPNVYYLPPLACGSITLKIEGQEPFAVFAPTFPGNVAYSDVFEVWFKRVDSSGPVGEWTIVPGLEPDGPRRMKWRNPEIGDFLFRYIPFGTNGAKGKFEEGPNCPGTIRFCASMLPGGIGVVKSVNASLIDTGNCTGHDIVVNWLADLMPDNPLFSHFEVRIKDASGAVVGTLALVYEAGFPFSHERQVSMGGPSSSYTFEVRAADVCGAATPWKEGTVRMLSCWTIADQNLRDDLQGKIDDLDNRIDNLPPPKLESDPAPKLSAGLDANCQDVTHPHLVGFSERVKQIDNPVHPIKLNLGEANTFILNAPSTATVFFEGGCKAGLPLKVIVKQGSTTSELTFNGVKWRNKKVVKTTKTAGAVDMYVFFYYGAEIGWVGADAGRDFG